MGWERTQLIVPHETFSKGSHALKWQINQLHRQSIMFTLKFQSNKDGTNTTVCGTRFDTQYFYDPEGAGHPTQCHITVYQKLTSDETGITFQVGGEHPLGYMVAYVENQQGKTIDRFGPYEREQLKAAA